MPEYLAPGVYVEEVSFRSKSISGVSTTTTGFVGPTRFGPLQLEPDILTSLSDFEATYGDGQPLTFTDTGTQTNFLWHAARAFFEEGGQRLYVVRVFRPPTDGTTGYATWQVPNGLSADNLLGVSARWPGAAGNLRVRYTLRIGQNVLSSQKDPATGFKVSTVGGIFDKDVVWIGHLDPGAPLSSPVIPPSYKGSFYLAEQYLNTATQEDTWRFHPKTGQPIELRSGSPPGLNPGADEVRQVSLSVTVFPLDPNAASQVWDGLALDPAHQRGGGLDSVTALFAKWPSNQSLARTLPITITTGKNLLSGLDVLSALSAASGSAMGAASWVSTASLSPSFDFPLTGGDDGARPTSAQYEGTANDTDTFKTGLKALEDLDDVSIVAAPGSTFGYLANGQLHQDDVMETLNLLIGHAERMRYRIAVLDSGDQMAIADVRQMRGQIDSTYAAFYYPWVKIVDPITNTELNLPPSGFVAGIYARNDINRAVYKAPANEVVTLAIGFEKLLNKGQQEVLNPEGINCFRFFEGRGYRLWGARLTSSDPEWKYVNLRRYFAYLERSIDVGTQWAVFEPNGPPLWTNVRRTISDFLFSEFQSGALLGDKPEQAFFVRCDRSTMNQNDLDNGRMVCLIGVAPVKPAEFVIFRIGQWTASSTG
jgi:uncharacterized protein